MEENNSTIDALEKKVEQIIADNRMLRSELKKTVAQRDKTSVLKRKAEERVMELEKRVRTLETTGAFVSTATDTQAARARVNRLLREIDSCIALMNT